MARALLAALLVWVMLLSLGYKLARPSAYMSALRRYTALANFGVAKTRALAGLTVIGEVATVTCLILRDTQAAGAGLAAAQFFSYSIVIALDRRERIADCGCWGLKIVSTRTGLLARNAILFATASALCVISVTASPGSYRNMIAALMLAVPFALLLIEFPTLLRVATNK